MHPVRRRKKRPNYGVKTVEITRGKNGFGFTISGQQPCILSCIVNGSPAEKAGLRPGDYLVAVNGHSVSKLPHDDVVRLIGCLDGALKLQIAENYYSDSSDEDNITSVRSKPKFVHKPRNANANNYTNNFQVNRTAKLVRDLKNNSAYDKFEGEEAALPVNELLNSSLNIPVPPPPRASNACHSADIKEELIFVVGYLGTIEMPKQIQPGCRPQVVRGCIKRLRTEKRSHSWVLMKVHADGVTVAGSSGKILAEYPVGRIIFCGPSSDEDKKYFGLVTTACGDGNDVLPSSSCHVFAVQSNLFEHQKHFNKADAFKITCTTGTLSQGCFEFPSTSEPILNAVKSFCLTKIEGNRHMIQNEMILANSPQPSHSGSTAASSNSDSGIGFRDDYGNQSDRIVMVDIENQRLHIQQLYNTSNNLGMSPNSLNIKLQSPDGATETPSANLQHAFACVNALCPLPVALDPLYGSCSIDHRLTVRALPNSKIPTSNRSRSPLVSSSSSCDEDNTRMNHSHIKHVSLKMKGDRSSTKYFENEISSKSLPPSRLWYEKSIFYQLGLLPDQSFSCEGQKGICSSNYKATSKSSDNLDSSIEKRDSNASSKVNSKSTDNLMQITSNSEFSYNSHKPNHQVSGSRFPTSLNFASQNLNSPLSISYGEGSVIQSNMEQNERPKCGSGGTIIWSCEKSDEALLSFGMTPRLNFCKEQSPISRKPSEKDMYKRHFFKSMDDMSICSCKSNDAILSYKLSPKVFGMKKMFVTQSLEDLKASDDMRNSTEEMLDNAKLQQWGSLQDLRSFTPGTFETSLVPKTTAFDGKASLEEDKGEDGIVAWARSFEKLLEDPAGLTAFSEFLKKEFSQENITFWISCEKYKTLEDKCERKKLACEIFENHLSMGATEPVNIDAHAHQCTQEKLDEAPIDLFVLAQKQIFNLMKFDSYPRFLKSDVYKERLLKELSNEDLPYNGNLDQGGAEVISSRGKLKKSRSDAEDSSRKSLLPWHRKNRSKSKDRGESEYKLSTLEQKKENEDVVSVRSEITGSRSSLASWDLALRGSFSRQSITSGEVSERETCQLCRVILSDGATTVVQVRHKETVRELIHRLLEKRGLHYSSFELYVSGSSKPLPLDEDASCLSNKEVRVEQRVVFRIDLPNRRTVSVKAKPAKNLGQMSDNEVLELNIPVTVVDGRRLTALTRSSDSWKNDCTSGQGGGITSSKTFVKVAPTLDEITNKVFEEVLQGKSEGVGKSDQGSLKSEEWGSEHSSGIISKFLRRDSIFHEKSKSKSRGGTSRQLLEGASKHVEGMVSMVTGKPPLIGKWKSGNKLSGKSESDELYEGLKRAQRNRLEDQRGTEINFELPDFLKDKENTPQSGKKLRRFRREDGVTTPKFQDPERPHDNHHHEITQMPVKNTPKSEKFNTSLKTAENKSKTDSSAAAIRKVEHTGRIVTKPLTCKTYETPKTTPIKNELTMDNAKQSELSEGFETSNKRSSFTRKSDPPPLPPKPKYLPQKPLPWSHGRIPQEITNKQPPFLKTSDIKRDNKFARSRRTVYLDQPSSSFV